MTEKKPGIISDIAADGITSTDIFRTVFERIQTAIMIIDPEAHRIVDANPLMETLTGLTRDQLLGKGCQGHVCPAKHGECPVTDLRKNVLNIEREIINSRGERVPVLKTVAKANIGGKEYLIESFIDITDRKKAEDRRMELIAFINEAVSRVNKPMELTIANLQNIVDVAKTGVYDAEDLRMQLQIQTNNLRQMVSNLKEISEKVTKKETDIPEAFREYFSGK